MFTKAIFEGMLKVRYSVRDFMVPLAVGAAGCSSFRCCSHIPGTAHQRPPKAFFPNAPTTYYSS
jgi:hypothetical protein